MSPFRERCPPITVSDSEFALPRRGLHLLVGEEPAIRVGEPIRVWPLVRGVLVGGVQFTLDCKMFPLRMNVFQLALKSNELSSFLVAVLLQPVGEHQSWRIVLQICLDRGEKRLPAGWVGERVIDGRRLRTAGHDVTRPGRIAAGME